MQWEPQEPFKNSTPPDQAGTWILPVRDWNTDVSSHPHDVPIQNYCLATGVDGRAPGIERSPGFKTWMDLSDSSTFQTLFSRVRTGDGETQQYQSRGIAEISPFRIAKTSAAGELYGVVVQIWNGYRTITTDPFSITYSDQYYETYVVFKDPYGKDSTYLDGIDSSNYTVLGPVKLHVQIAATPANLRSTYLLNVLAWGRFLYIMGPSDASRVLWYGPFTDVDGGAVALHQDGWRIDRFGTPDIRALHAEATNDNVTTGFTLNRFYNVVARLYDSVRNRLSNPAYGYRTAKATPTSPNHTSHTAAACAANKVVQVDLWHSFWTTDYWPVCAAPNDAPKIGRGLWDKWIPYCSLASADNTKADGGPFYEVDVASVKPAWTNATGGNQPGAAKLLIDSERYVDPDDVNFQKCPATDRMLAASAQLDYELDHFVNWDEMQHIYASAAFQGLHVVLAKVQMSDVQTPGTPGPSVYLCWSDPRRGNANENFPITCTYPTRYANPQYIKRYLEVQDWPFDLPLETGPAMAALVPCGGALYAFADGPVYRLTRSADVSAGAFVEDLSGNYPLLSKYSVASWGEGAIIGTELGFFILEGASGTLTEVPQLARLLKQRWTTPELRHSVSMAYDAVMDAVYILCGCTGEVIVLWLATNRITMEGPTNFNYVRAAQIPDSTQTSRQRALFATWHGKLCYPDHEQVMTDGRYTMHGIRQYQESYTVPTNFVVRIYQQEATSDAQTSITKLWPSVDLGGSTNTRLDIESILIRDVTLRFVTGPLAGRTVATYWKEFNDGGYPLLVAVGDITGSGSLVGSLAVLDPVPTTVVGRPLVGRSLKPYLERKKVTSILPVLANLQGKYADWNTYVPWVSVGVCEIGALRATEPAPNGLWRSASPGALPDWIDWTHTSVAEAASPPLGTDLDEERPYEGYCYLEKPTGVAGHSLLPVLRVDGSGFSFALLAWYVSGIIEETEVAR